MSAGYRGRQRQAGLLRMPLWSDRGGKWVPMDRKRTGAGGGALGFNIGPTGPRVQRERYIVSEWVPLESE